ncbi:MAG: hypothetical protein ACREK6_16640 [Candidatus Rokuibacteriota bacterium]
MGKAGARPRPSRLSGGRILGELRVAARRGDRAALALAVDQMRTLALSPRYWEKYLTLLRNPLARLVDLLLIKQGDRIAQQKGWKKPAGRSRPAVAPRPSPGVRRRPRRPPAGPEQPALFEL